MLAPTKHSALNRPQRVLRLRRGPSLQVREREYTLDEVLAPIETTTDLCRHYTSGCKPADSPFEWSKVGESIHRPQSTPSWFAGSLGRWNIHLRFLYRVGGGDKPGPLSIEACERMQAELPIGTARLRSGPCRVSGPERAIWRVSCCS